MIELYRNEELHCFVCFYMACFFWYIMFAVKECRVLIDNKKIFVVWVLYLTKGGERKRTNEYIGKIPLNNSYDIIRCISQHKKKISKICLLFIKWTTREQSNISIFLYNCKILKNIQKAFTGKSTTFYWKYEFLNHQTELITEILILILNN